MWQWLYVWMTRGLHNLLCAGMCVCLGTAYVYVCLHVCMCICTHGCVWLCTHTHVCVWAVVCGWMGVHVCAHVYVYSCVILQVCVRVCTDVCMCSCIFVGNDQLMGVILWCGGWIGQCPMHVCMCACGCACVCMSRMCLHAADMCVCLYASIMYASLPVRPQCLCPIVLATPCMTACVLACVYV